MILIKDRLNFYSEYCSLEILKNNVLVLLTFSPIRYIIDQALVEWAASVDGWSLYEQIIKDIQNPESKKQFVLLLAALLYYQ